jgi:hypothetical protein
MGGDGPLPEFVAEEVQQLLGAEMREVVGDLELADAGRQAMA